MATKIAIDGLGGQILEGTIGGMIVHLPDAVGIVIYTRRVMDFSCDHISKCWQE